jgi:hypothetical protein
LGSLVALTLVFASLTLIEYQQVSVLTLQVQSSQSKPASTLLPFPHSESEISQFCKFGSLIGGVNQQQMQNASGQTITTIFRPVLAMQTPSTAYACVTYQPVLTGPPPQNSAFYNRPITFGFHLFVCQKVGQTGIGCSPSQALSGGAFPSQITFTNSTSAFTVVYNVTSMIGSAGFYDSAGDLFWGYPLAAGYETPQLNASDFHILLSLHTTAYEPIRAASVTVIGMSWTYVEFQCTSDTLSCISGK